MHDFDELIAFDSVMVSKSLTQSANALGLAKSTVSRRIGLLENRLGQPLLRRQANRLVATEAGVIFHAYCRDILALSAKGRAALDNLRKDLSGAMTIELHPALLDTPLAHALEQFAKRHPAITLTLYTCTRTCERPDNHSIRLGLGPDAAGIATLRQEPLGLLYRSLYASPCYLATHGSPTQPRELEQYTWVNRLNDGTDGSLTLLHPQQPSVTLKLPPSQLRSDIPTLQLSALVAGQGIGPLPRRLAESHLQNGQLAACLTPWQPEPLAVTLLYPFGHLPRRHQALLEFLRRHVPAAWQPTAVTSDTVEQAE